MRAKELELVCRLARSAFERYRREHAHVACRTIMCSLESKNGDYFRLSRIFSTAESPAIPRSVNPFVSEGFLIASSGVKASVNPKWVGFSSEHLFYEGCLEPNRSGDRGWAILISGSGLRICSGQVGFLGRDLLVMCPFIPSQRREIDRVSPPRFSEKSVSLALTVRIARRES
jgi:hypothetical protein